MSGDLIIKQALLKEIKEKIIPDKYGTSNAVLDVMGAVLRVIGEQPTAYDVEKVIQQLDKLKTYKLGLADAMSEIMRRGELGTYVCLEDVLEIVKSGGIAVGQKGERE